MKTSKISTIARITFLFILLATMSSYTLQSFQQEVPEEYGYIVKLGQKAPNFDLVMPNGERTSIEQLRGKVIMLQFTASWCPVCRKEMPHIENEIWQKHKNDTNFALFGIDLKEDAKKVEEFQKDMKTSYPLALDEDGTIFYTYAAQDAGVTRNVIIDKTGTIVFMTRLFKEEEFNEMKKVIDKLLEVKEK